MPSVPPSRPSSAAASPGGTEVLRWHGGKRAVFLLGFDDSVPSHLRVAVPALASRGMVGTFYINPALPPYLSCRAQWEAPSPGMVYANHTVSHAGATTVAQLEEELEGCSEVIERCFPHAKQPRLVSFGQPGGVPWTVSRPDIDAALARRHLIERPPFQGYPFNVRTAEAMLALVDTALATGEMESHVFHGVGADCHPTPVGMFTALLDKLAAHRGDLWITDPVSWHQYRTERDTAAVRVLAASGDHLRLSLTCTADPALYDLPLSLLTHVPATWQTCVVTQDQRSTELPVVAGRVSYDAVPGAGEIVLQLAPA